MINLCPNCGCEQPENAKYCHNCGTLIDDKPIETEYEHDFNGTGNGDGPMTEQQFTQQFSEPVVETTIDPVKANKYKKQIFSWSIFILVASVLGLILNLLELEDYAELKSYLPMILDEYYGVVSTAVNVYYAGVVLLAFMAVASIAFMVLTIKLNKFNFPVPDDKVFGVAKKAFYASIAVSVIEAVLLIVEFISVVNLVKMQIMLDELDFNMATSVFFVIKDFAIFCGTVASMIFALKLSKCKKNDAPFGM